MSGIKDILGYLGGALVAIQLYPQIYAIYVKKSAESVSLMFVAINISGLACLLLYSLSLKELPLVVSTGIGLANSIVLYFTTLSFRRNNNLEITL